MDAFPAAKKPDAGAIPSAAPARGVHLEGLPLREVAERAGWTIAFEYLKTISGAAKARPAFDRIIADARRRRFDTIMAVDVSRLGRSLKELVDPRHRDRGQGPGCGPRVDHRPDARQGPPVHRRFIGRLPCRWRVAPGAGRNRRRAQCRAAVHRPQPRP